MQNEIELDNGINGKQPLLGKKQSKQRKSTLTKRTSSIYEGKKDYLEARVTDLQKSSLSEYQSNDLLQEQLSSFSLENKLQLLKKSVLEGEVQDFLIIFDHFRNLEQKPKINQKIDQKDQTLLHIACFKNLPIVVENLLSYEKVVSTQYEFEEWINLINNEGFASIHFAAYVGSISILESLQKYGADISIKNSQGQNSISIAAQGDQVSAMIWLYLQGQSFIDQDSQGGTPLHWATYFDSYFALQFLLTWIKSLPNKQYYINLKDSEGMTPLHLAAITGNMRIAKKLVQNGANKFIKDEKGLTPAQAALENEYQTVYDLLQNQNCLLEFLNIRQSLKPPSISWNQIIAFFFIYFFCMIGTILFVYPFYTKNYWLQYLSMASFVLGIIFYFLTMFVKPGYVDKIQDKNILSKLIKEVEPWEICQECLIKKPKRSRHCDYCKKCVIVYDHHCPWVNNCIGAKNYSIYFIFIFLIWINLLHIIIINCIFIGKQYHDYLPNNYYIWFNNYQDSNTLTIIKIIIQSCIIFLGILFFIAVSHLMYGQIITLFTNKTTFEKYKQQEMFQDQGKTKSQQKLKYEQSIQNNQSKCEFKNCIVMCCLNSKDKNYQ